MIKLPSCVKKYFWEVDTNKLNLRNDADYIIGRLLQYGDVCGLKWLLNNVDVENIQEVIKKRRGLSKRSVNFWQLFFNIPKNKILCLKKSYQNQHKILWPY